VKPFSKLERRSADFKKCALSDILVLFYRLKRIRSAIVKCALVLEGGEMFSWTLRKILITYYGVEVGAYSYGECSKPAAFPAGVSVGRYASIASGVRVFRRNHPVAHLSTHPFFYNSTLGWVSTDCEPRANPLIIEHDAWVGAGAIITPRCSRVGIGAVVGAGSVVTADVPDFAIVVGAPARVIRYRFSDDEQERIRRGNWWNLPVEELMVFRDAMTMSVKCVPVTHPLMVDTAPRPLNQVDDRVSSDRIDSRRNQGHPI